MTTPDEFTPPEKSKSQRKREMTALQELGESLIKLTPAQLNQLPISEKLRDAIAAAQSITSHGAAQRQRQYIGRLMRTEEAEAITQALARLFPGR